MIKKAKDPGFGYNSTENVKEIIDKDGNSNIVHHNRKFSVDDLYTFFIDLSWWHFFILVILGYTFLNICFGLLYTVIGIEQITPSKGDFFKDFLNGFFFSAQTLTTVGYGGIVPKGILANIIASFEAMIGLLSFSFITGLLYGRFSKAKAAIRFSDHVIVRDFKKEKALMFRLMNSRKSIMIEPEATVTLSINKVDELGNYKRSFFELQLEREKITYLPTLWTIVHEINKESPFYGLSNEEMISLDANLYVLIQYHEESYAQKVYQATTYNCSELIFNKKFKSSTTFNEDGYTILDHEKLNDVEAL